MMYVLRNGEGKCLIVTPTAYASNRFNGWTFCQTISLTADRRNTHQGDNNHA